MKVRKLLKWIVIIVVLGLAIGAAVLHFGSSAVPAAYQPPDLSSDKREEVARKFVLKIQDFGNMAGRNQPFDWSISEGEINDVLASLDEIAAMAAEEGKSPDMRTMMDKVGISSPAVSLQDGVLTIMMHSRELGKVVSADLALTITPDKRLKVQMVGGRVGYLPVPQSIVQKGMDKLKAGLARRSSQTHPSSDMTYAGMSYDDISGVMGQIIAAIDGPPMLTEHTWPINKRRVRVEGLTIQDGDLTLHVVPIDKERNK